MDTAVISGIVGLASSLMTLMVTHWLNIRGERKKAEVQERVDQEKAERAAKASADLATKEAALKEANRRQQTQVAYTEARIKKDRASLLSLTQIEARAVLNVVSSIDPRPSSVRTIFLPFDIRLTVGSDPEGDVQLFEEIDRVSPVHCTFNCKRPRQCWLDVISPAGVLLNDVAVGTGSHELRDGDAIMIGEHILSFRWLASAATEQ
jgi:hypothetical protein